MSWKGELGDNTHQCLTMTSALGSAPDATEAVAVLAVASAVVGRCHAGFESEATKIVFAAMLQASALGLLREGMSVKGYANCL